MQKRQIHFKPQQQSEYKEPIRCRVKGSILCLLLIAIGVFSVPMTIAYRNLSGHGPAGENDEINVIFFGTMVVLSISLLVSLNKFYVHNQKLEIRSVLGFRKRIIYLDEITEWSQETSNINIHKHSPMFEGYQLTLYLKKGKYTISSNIYTHYDELKVALTYDKPFRKC